MEISTGAGRKCDGGNAKSWVQGRISTSASERTMSVGQAANQRGRRRGITPGTATFEAAGGNIGIPTRPTGACRKSLESTTECP